MTSSRVILSVLAHNILVEHPTVPANNEKELIATAKAKRGALSFASSGNGTVSHLAGELFNTLAGTHMVHVPYEGSSPAMVASAVWSGRCDVRQPRVRSAASA